MEDNKEHAAATEPVAAQPEATDTPPAKSAAETKLESQLAAAKTKGEGYKKERDTARTELTAARGELAKVSEERDALRNENTQLKAQPTLPATSQPEATVAATEPSEEEQIKDVLKRNGLTKAYMLPTGPCFSEQHARQYAGEEFDTLTVITAE